MKTLIPGLFSPRNILHAFGIKFEKVGLVDFHPTTKLQISGILTRVLVDCSEPVTVARRVRVYHSRTRYRVNNGLLCEWILAYFSDALSLAMLTFPL